MKHIKLYEQFINEKTNVKIGKTYFITKGDDSMDIDPGKYLIIKKYKQDGEDVYDVKSENGQIVTLTADYVHGLGYWKNSGLLESVDEEYLSEKKLSTPPKSYADESFWNKSFPHGLDVKFVDRPKFKSVLASISYDLGLNFGGPKNDTPMDISDLGMSISNRDGDEIILKGAFNGDYSYGEMKDAVEKWAKKKGLI